MPKAEYKNRKYDVQPYNPAWSDQFQSIASVVRDIFGRDAIAVEHIGSTAVPGMIGKPTIDVLVLVEDISAVGRHIAAMKDAGYEYLVNYVSPGTVLFRRMEGDTLLENIHVFQKEHPHVQEMLSLREYLRAHPEEVKAYSDTKNELFQKYPNEYAKYREIKDAYMDGLKKRVGRKII